MRLPKPHIIEFDVKDLSQCQIVASDLYEMIEQQHGPLIAQRIFSETTPTKKRLAFNKNVALMVAYRKKQHLGLDRAATELAKENEKLPPDRRLGPRGATSPPTMAKHIRRQLKLMSKNEYFKLVVETIESGLAVWDIDWPPADISE
jgi:hypothetical protein